MKAYIVPGAKWGTGDRAYHLIREDGVVVASHVCSSPGFAHADLWSGREERRAENPEITEVVWINDQDDVTEEELRERNREWAGREETP